MKKKIIKTKIKILGAILFCCGGRFIHAADDVVGDFLKGGLEETLDLAKDFGAVNVETGDISFLEFDVTSCNQNVVSKCAKGATCNVTIGPCKYQQQPKSLNAAPRELSFTRYLTTNSHTESFVEPGSNIHLNLTEVNSFTQIINTTVQGRGVSYMIMILPTNPTFVDNIKNLPKALAKYLKSEKNNEDFIIKIYKKIDASTVWEEIADQQVNVIYTKDFKLPVNQIIGNARIGEDGSLIVTYYNVGDIPELNVMYQPF